MILVLSHACHGAHEGASITGALHLNSQVFSESPGLKLQRRAFIVWDDGGPQSVFIVKKPHSLEASAKMKEIGDW